MCSSVHVLCSSDKCIFVSADLRQRDYFIIVGCREDFHAPDLSQLLDVVKVMSFAVTQGKAAVHCHAGLGRTGVLIACFLVFKERMNPSTAIRHVREKRWAGWGRLTDRGREVRYYKATALSLHCRPGSIQTSVQVEVVKAFSVYLHPLWIVFPSR